MLDNITELRTFVRIVGAGSLSAASREMGLALSVVSKRLASLGLDVFCNTQVTFDTSVNNARSECARIVVSQRTTRLRKSVPVTWCGSRPVRSTGTARRPPRP